MKLVKRHRVEFLAVVVGGGPGKSELPKIVVSVGDHFVWLSQRSCLNQDKKETEEEGEFLSHGVVSMYKFNQYQYCKTLNRINELTINC